VAQPVKVLHIITRLILGGAQENTLFTAIGQHDNPDMDVTLLCGIDPGPEGDLHNQAHTAGVKLVLMKRLVRPIRPLNDLINLYELYRFIRKERFDVVHTHSSKAGISGRIAAKMAGVPIIIHTLHSLVFHEYQAAWKNWLYILLKKVCAPLSDALISVNQKTIDGAIAENIGRPEQYIKIFSGMPLKKFLNIRDELTVADAKERLGIPRDAPVVGKIARLFALKGHEQFFDMVEVVAKVEPRAYFLLVGDGLLREQLEARARQMGIAERVVFAGLVDPDDVAAHIQAMDVVVHTSLREGLARVLPQAGAVGKPVATFDLDGAPEVVRDGNCGYLVPPKDTDALAVKVIELLGDPELREEFGAAGRVFASQHFLVEHMVREVNQVYYRFFEKLGK